MPKTPLAFLAAALLFNAYAHGASSPEQVVAVIDGKPILDKDLEERAAPQLRELNSKVFDVKEQALNDMIDEQVLKQEAARLNVSVRQLLDREVNSLLNEPTSSEVESYYLGVQDRVGRPLDEIRPQLVEYLTEIRRRDAYKSYLSGLRSRDKVLVLLAPPRGNVSIDPTRVRGPANAPITIVEFSDFECPYCGRAEQTLRQLVVKYPAQIRLAYRDFPLDSHPRARPSAEASRCALAQGKYWQYHDLLFANQEHLQDGDLSKLAAQVGMDRKKFDECTAQRIYKADIQRDLDEGERLGINGTPVFFVNGISLSGAVSLQEFSRVIGDELERIKSQK
jgi:predicted DsbA family dithiol-disulfide isomerase